MSERLLAEGRIAARVFGAIGHVVLNNPLRKNAVSLAMWTALPDALQWLVTVGEVRVIILMGDGGKDFSAGADIAEFSETRKDRASTLAYETANSNAFGAFEACPVPIIAMIRGVCFGGGFGLAAACDIRIADETARFAIPAARLGLVYPPRDVAAIATRLGDQKTKLMLYSGNEMTARHMAESGFLLNLVHSERLTADTNELASTIAGNAPLSVRAAKLAVRAWAEGDKALADAAMVLSEQSAESRDYAEGRLAFAERRKPNFQGR